MGAICNDFQPKRKGHTMNDEMKPNHYPVDLTKAVAITTKTGELKLFQTNIELSIDNGGLVKCGGAGVICTAEGYKMQAAAAGLQTMMAHSVIVDGIEQKNPTVQRCPTTNRPIVVTCRAFTMGYTSKGIPIVVDRTVSFDLNACRAHDLLKKCKNCPDNFKLYGIERKPASGWTRYPINDVEAVHVQRSSVEGLKFSTDQANIAKKAVERAQTYAARNSIKAHPSIRVHKVQGYSTWVSLLCWRPVTGSAMQWDLSQFNAHLEQIEAAASGTQPAGNLQLDQATEHVHDDEEARASVEASEFDEDHEEGQEGSPVNRLRKELAELSEQEDKRDHIIQTISEVTELDPALIMIPEVLDTMTDQQIIKTHKSLK